MVGRIMTSTDDLLSRIRAFCAERKMAETTFGRLAVNDGKLVGRLQDGGTISLRTLARIESTLAQEQPEAAA